MAKPTVSLKSSLRTSVLASYRSRGRAVNNLWLVYSAKTNSDWMLPSDRQLIHWLFFLELNPEVESFDLSPELILSHDDKEVRATQLDAIVHLRSGEIEWHEVKSGTNYDDPTHQSQLIAQAAAASKNRVLYKRFNDNDLKSKVRVSLRLLKALGYAAAIRDQDHLQCRTELVIYLKEVEKGTIGQVLADFEIYDSAVILGLIIRLFVKDVISLNLDKYSFGLLTQWQFIGQRQ